MMVRTVDTDVVVLCVSVMEQLDATELWIVFGVGKGFRYLSAHSISHALGKEKSRSLPIFHAFTGCDQTSFFTGKGKKTAWSTSEVFDDVTEAFTRLMNIPTLNVLDYVMPTLERFVVLMYDRSSTCTTVNDARKEIFAHKGGPIEAVPPTADALLQHSKRATYQAGFCWAYCLIPAPRLPSSSDWGWQKGPDQLWEPQWITLPDAPQACQERLKCGRKVEKGYMQRCKCVKADLPCTALCKCGGECERE